MAQAGSVVVATGTLTTVSSSSSNTPVYDPVAYASFCESQLQQYESERDAFLRTLDSVKASEEEQLRLRWVLRAREDELAQATAERVVSKQLLLAAQQDLELLMSENDALRNRECEDRRIIGELLAMTHPLINEGGTSSSSSSSTTTSRKAGISRSKGYSSGSLETLPPPKLRTKSYHHRLLEIQELLRQRDATDSHEGSASNSSSSNVISVEDACKELLKQKDAEHQRELQRCGDEKQAMAAAVKAAEEQHLAELGKVKATLFWATRELCQYRHEAQIQRRGLQQQLLTEQKRVEELQKTVQQNSEEFEKRQQSICKQLTQDRDKQLRHIRTQARQREHRLHEKEYELAVVKQGTAQQLQQLNQQLTSAKLRYEHASTFRRLSVAGCESELELLKAQLARLEKRLPFHSAAAVAAAATPNYYTAPTGGAEGVTCPQCQDKITAAAATDNHRQCHHHYRQM